MTALAAAESERTPANAAAAKSFINVLRWILVVGEQQGSDEKYARAGVRFGGFGAVLLAGQRYFGARHGTSRGTAAQRAAAGVAVVGALGAVPDALGEQVEDQVVDPQRLAHVIRRLRVLPGGL